MGAEESEPHTHWQGGRLIFGKSFSIANQPTIQSPPPHTHTYYSIVIVLDKVYRDDFAFLQKQDPRIVFADPGK
jgi:hypothetical protein